MVQVLECTLTVNERPGVRGWKSAASSSIGPGVRVTVVAEPSFSRVVCIRLLQQPVRTGVVDCASISSEVVSHLDAADLRPALLDGLLHGVQVMHLELIRGASLLDARAHGGALFIERGGVIQLIADGPCCRLGLLGLLVLRRGLLLAGDCGG